MSITEDIEEKMGIRIEDLSDIEKQTYFSMLETYSTAQITPEKMHEYISSMREGIEKELIDEPEFNYIWIFKVPNRKQILLKSRLKNYLLLESFCISPRRAKEQLESMLSNIQKVR